MKPAEASRASGKGPKMHRKAIRIGTAFCFMAVVLLSASDVHARRGRSSAYRNIIRRAMQNVQKDIAAVQKELKSSQEQLSKEAQQLTTAKAAFKEAQADVKRAKSTLVERLGPKVGLPEAQSAVEAAQAAYDEAVGQAVLQLRSTSEYQQADQNLKDAEEQLAALRNDKSSGSRRKELLSQAAKKSLEAREAKRLLIDRHPTVKPAKEALDQAAAKLNEAHSKLRREIKNDSSLESAESEFRRAKSTLEQAENTVATLEVKITALQGRLLGDHQMIGR